MDQRLAASRDTSDERADAQLCNLVLSKVEPDLVEETWPYPPSRIYSRAPTLAVRGLRRLGPGSRRLSR